MSISDFAPLSAFDDGTPKDPLEAAMQSRDRDILNIVRQSLDHGNAKLAFQPKMGGGVDCAHLQRDQRVTAAGDGMAQHAVHMAIIHQGAGMAIIGAKNEVATIQPLFRNRGDLAFHIVPCRPKSHHRAHSKPYAGNGIFFAGALMVVSRATGSIGCKAIQIRAGVMLTRGD